MALRVLLFTVRSEVNMRQALLCCRCYKQSSSALLKAASRDVGLGCCVGTTPRNAPLPSPIRACKPLHRPFKACRGWGSACHLHTSVPLIHSPAGGLLADPYETVVPAEAFPLPSVAALAPMTVHDVQCGRYRAEMFLDWMRRSCPDDPSIPI